ncbi:MAG TPA: MSMEG_4193 family putative phosphomutase [Methylomirabilota bacterium]|nr:MSMEG_4193 family putative phosphomutase [Methylomirabilota bacterium]
MGDSSTRVRGCVGRDGSLPSTAVRHGSASIRNGHRPKATLVLLVRHGRTATTGRILPGRAPGLHLAEAGLREAETVAARIARMPGVAAVYSSPLERARETADRIGAARGLAVVVDPDLSECDSGAWTGAELRALAKKPEWRIVQHHPSGFRFPAGESFPEMQARVTAAVTRLVASHPGQAVVAVSHADPIKAAVAQALGTPLDLFQRIMVDTASVTAIAYRPVGPTVLTVNSTGGDLPMLHRR